MIHTPAAILTIRGGEENSVSSLGARADGGHCNKVKYGLEVEVEVKVEMG